MNRSLALALAGSLALCAACSGTKTTQNQDAGQDSGTCFTPPIITVSGTASLFPPAAAWLADAGLPAPALPGLTLRVIEPFKVALGDSNGVFGTQVLDATGAFSISNVQTAQVVLGVAGDIRDVEPGVCDGGEPTDAGCQRPRVMPVATTLFDVRLAGSTPQMNITGGKVYGMPTAFHDQLTAAVTAPVIESITDAGGNPQDTLIGAGFILGQVVDATGAPVPNVSVVPLPASNAAQFFYPSDDFTTVNQTGTGQSGLFLYVHNGGQVGTFTFTIAGHSEYLERNGGATAGAGLIEVVFPGTTAP